MKMPNPIQIISKRQEGDQTDQESQSVNPQVLSPDEKLKTITKNIKKPKIFTLGILLLTIIVTVLALNMFSKKDGQDQFLPTQNLFQSPEASFDPELQNVAEKIEKYNKKLDNLKNYPREIIYPIVDLAIEFD